MNMRAIGIKMNFMMGLSMSILLSLVGTLLGGHFTVPSWLFSLGISFVISIVIGFAVPIKKLGDGLCEKCKTNPMSFKGTLISAIVSDLIYTPIITIVMVVLMLNLAAKHAPAGAVPPVSKVLPMSLVVCLIVGYIAIIIFQPLFMKMLLKNNQK